MRFLVPALLIASLLAVPTTQAQPCASLDPLGDYVDCMYGYATGRGGEVVDQATDAIDGLGDKLPVVDPGFLPFCVREPFHPSCWT